MSRGPREGALQHLSREEKKRRMFRAGSYFDLYSDDPRFDWLTWYLESWASGTGGGSGNEHRLKQQETQFIDGTGLHRRDLFMLRERYGSNYPMTRAELNRLRYLERKAQVFKGGLYGSAVHS